MTDVLPARPAHELPRFLRADAAALATVADRIEAGEIDDDTITHLRLALMSVELCARDLTADAAS